MMRIFLSAIVFALIVGVSGLFQTAGYAQTVPAQTLAQTPTQTATVAAPSPKDIHELMRLLADDGIRNWMVKNAGQPDLAGPSVTTVGIRNQLGAALDKFRARIGALREAWVNLPRVPEHIADRLQENVHQVDMLRNLTYVIIFLFFGAGLEWLYRQYTTAQLTRVTLRVQKNPTRRVSAAAVRALIIFLGLVLFAFGSIGIFLTFDWLPIVENTVLNLLIVVISIRTARTLSLFLLAPNVPDLRLVPLSNRSAKYYHRSGLWIVGIFTFCVAATDLFARIANEESGPAAPEALAVLVLASMVFLVALLSQIWRGAKHESIDADRAKLRRVFFWRVYLSVLAVFGWLLLLIGAQNVMWSLLILGAIKPLLALAKAWVDHFFDLATQAYLLSRAQAAENAKAQAMEAAEGEDAAEPEQADEPEETAGDAEPLEGPYDSFRPIVRRVVRFIVIVTAVLVLTDVWGTSILALSQAPTIAGRAFSALVNTVVVVLIADLIWTWARGVIDKRLAAYVPPEGSEAPGPEARMATLLPLLRMTLLVTLLVIVLFSVLSSLGVNIAPLLAGAGVLGIAIGFGAQSLVRDIVSGIFFLIDDAFRLGEYIEVGDLRGTVESISIRSLRVRHHRGMVHTIPFGELKYLTNYSRDWVIMKLEFRVPFDTDLKLVKKLVKNIGAELLANEFYGHSILQTLKSQGVRRMEEFNMVVGVKFMTKPGEQWLVRRDAYQKVRDAFEANGIRLAERNVKVEIQGGEDLNEATRQAVAGAAQQAVDGPGGPPKAVPDEP